MTKAEKKKLNGYDYADEIHKRIGKNKDHEISLEDALNVIGFWGFNEEAPKVTTIGFVCYCARERIKKAFEKALVYGDFRTYKALSRRMDKLYKEK